MEAGAKKARKLLANLTTSLSIVQSDTKKYHWKNGWKMVAENHYFDLEI